MPDHKLRGAVRMSHWRIFAAAAAGCTLAGHSIVLSQTVPSIAQIAEDVRATLVSADGSVVAGLAPRVGGTWEAFRWSEHEGFALLGVAPHPCDAEPFDPRCTAVGSAPYALSADGSRVVGANGVLNVPWSFVYPFVWDGKDGFRVIAPVEAFAAAISDDGRQVVGSFGGISSIWTDEHGWRDVEPSLRAPVFPNMFTSVWSVSADAGVIPGGSTASSNAAVWIDGAVRDIAPPGALEHGPECIRERALRGGLGIDR